MICVSFNKSQWLQQYLPFTVLKHLFSSLLFFFCFIFRLQQYLPFTVLKLITNCYNKPELICCNSTYRLRYWNGISRWYNVAECLAELQQYLPFTVLKLSLRHIQILWPYLVATVLTVYGIETSCIFNFRDNNSIQLQQYLPFTVLKR